MQHVDAEGNETTSSGTKIFLYLVKGMLIYFKILRFGEVGVFFDRPPLYKLNNDSFLFNWRENIICMAFVRVHYLLRGANSFPRA